jgi:ADP-heptose:LPS heptosyltransferase
MIKRFDGLPNKIIVTNDKNLGFGKAHNNALEIAQGKYFLVLNNDMFLLEKGWDIKLIEELKNHNKSIVGIKGVNCTLRKDASGFYGDTLDYIEGSFLAGRTSHFKEFGLFSPTIRMFVGEDSDLSLRYKQIGFELRQLDIKFEHVEHSTLDLIDPTYKSKICKHNVNILIKRWSKYLTTRKFNNKILVSLSSLGIGDIICALPTIKALRTDHPTAVIDVESRFPDIFKNNPDVSTHIIFSRARKEDYDRVVKLDPDYSLLTPLHKSHEELAATTIIDSTPRLYLGAEEIKRGYDILKNVKEQFEKIVVCSLLMKRVEWKGRNWTLDNAREFMILMKKMFPTYCLVEIGKEIPSTGNADLDLIDKTNLRELFSIVLHADYFVGIDSLPFHVAQSFKKPSIILFGATEAVSRVIDDSHVFPITSRNTTCKGCYHIKKQSVFNSCGKNNEECMKGLTPVEVIDEIKRVIKKYKSKE